MLIPIGFCGYGLVGKDSAYFALKTNWPHGTVHRIAFADPLKVDLEACFARLKKHVPGFDPKDVATKKRLRDLYEIWGTGTARAFCPDIWIKEAEETFLNIQRDLSLTSSEQYIHLCVFTDTRNFNEFSWINSINGQTFYIKRPGYGPVGEKEAKSIPEILEKIPSLSDTSPEGLGILNDGTLASYQSLVISKVTSWISRQHPNHSAFKEVD